MTDGHVYSNTLEKFLQDVIDLIEFEDRDCFLRVGNFKEGETVCTVGRKDNPEETWNTLITHMRDRFGGREMLKVHHEGRHPFYVEASAEVLVDLIDH